MKSSLYGLMGLALMASAGGADMYGKPREKRRPNPLKPKIKKTLDNQVDYRHIGELPKGCKLIKHVLTYEKDGIHRISLNIDLVGATEKSAFKRLSKIKYQFKTFVGFSTIEALKEEKDLTITEL